VRGCGSESGKGGDPTAAQWGAGEPGVEADEVQGQRGQDVLAVGLGQAAIAGLVDVAAAGGLGDGALDPAAMGVALLPGVGGLLGAELLLGLVLGAGSEGPAAVPAPRWGGYTRCSKR